ncbi:MAG: hypothetical protein E5V33_23365 [Mesorhizobium sp.]|nr:MAG: hypothetical protein E5V33_23365 [Mesorhizobium sp.]
MPPQLPKAICAQWSFEILSSRIGRKTAFDFRKARGVHQSAGAYFPMDARRSRPHPFNRPISGRLQGIAACRRRIGPKIEDRSSEGVMHAISMA